MTSLTCYTVAMPMKLLIRCVGDLTTVGGSVLVVTSFRPLPVSFFVCLRGLGISKFILLWRFTYALAELSFWDVVTGARHTRETHAIWAHTRWQRKCIAGFWFFSDYGVQFTVCFNLAPWTGYLPLEMFSIWVFSNFLGVQSPLFFCVSIYSFHFISFYFTLFYLPFYIPFILLLVIKCNM
jgi:hypothetical protein